MNIKQSILTIGLLTALIFGSSSETRAAYSPPAKVTFTIDDGSRAIYDLAAPLFATHNLKAVVYGETFWLNSGEDWVMSWEQLRDLRDRLGWEIGSHSITHPNLTTVSDSQLNSELADSKKSFADHGFNVTSFSTPYGAYDNRVVKAIAKYYTSHRAAWGGHNIWPDVYNDYELKVLEIKHTTTPEEVMGWIDHAITHRQWLVLLLHDVVTGTPMEYEYNVNDLKKILDYTASKPIQVVTATEGINLASGQNLVSNGSFETAGGGFAAGWTRPSTSGVTLNTATNGNAPQPKNSIRIVGGNNQREIVSSEIPISASTEYLFKMFANGTTFTSGGWGVYIGEYDNGGNWLGGEWLGGHFGPYIGTSAYPYVPTAAGATKAKIHIFTEANSQLTLFIDSVELKAVGSVSPPSVSPTPTTETQPTATPTIVPTATPTTAVPTATPTGIPVPTATPTVPSSGNNLVPNHSFENVDGGGFVYEWSRDNGAISVDTNNKGYGTSPKNSLKIIAGAGQYTAVSNRIPVTAGVSYDLSYYLRMEGFSGGGTAVYIDEYDTSGNWVGGKWLGGRYWNASELISYTYTPSVASASMVEIHLFTEDNSNMTVYIDEVVLAKK